ncbi:MAG: hypothetical protein N2690_11985, partial [Rhodocyclaceae bacterium]|nr:hypothetical protein [Rhodocyclaceae bacterium]
MDERREVHQLTAPQLALLVDLERACSHTFWTLESLIRSRHQPSFEILFLHPKDHPIGQLLDRCAPAARHLGIDANADGAERFGAILAATAAEWLMELDCLEVKPHDWPWRLLRAPRLLADDPVPIGALRPKLIGADGRLIEIGQRRAPEGSLQPLGAGDDPEA